MNIKKEARSGGLEPQWYFVVLVTVAIAISYFDRQTLPVAIAAIQRNIPLEPAVLVAANSISALLRRAVCHRRAPARRARYASWLHAHHAVVVACLRPARPCDRIFACCWRARFCLAWEREEAFRQPRAWWLSGLRLHERSTAMGIINAGTAVGSLLAPPLIGSWCCHSGWRAVFFSPARSALHGSSGGRLRYRGRRRSSPSTTLDARLVAQKFTLGRDHLACAACRSSSSPSS